jgi:hypothetical protein
MAASEEAKTLVRDLTNVVARAVALTEIYGNANQKEIKDRVSAIGTGLTFNLVRESLHRDICLVVTGIFDDDKRSLTFDKARRELTEAIVDEPAHLAAALKLYETTKSEGWYAELVKLRNRVIAHTDTDREHDARFGDERNLLTVALEILSRLSRAVSLPFEPANIRAVYETDSNRFWGSLGKK